MEPKRTALSVALAAALALGIAGCGATTSGDAAGSSAMESPTVTTAASEDIKKDAAKTSGTMTAEVDLTQYEAGKAVRLWLPVPHDGDYQKITELAYSADSGTPLLYTDDMGNQMLYVEWGADADPATRKVTMSFHADRKENLRPDLVEDDSDTTDMSAYLQGSSMVQSDSEQVKNAAAEITKGKETDLEKVRAIYDWVVANMNRDENTKGCGQGDVCALLAGSMSGKCTDINSVFVGLCQASGIPAREHFGIRMNDGDCTTAQHCWAEFYLKGTGWVAADPADVLKAVLKNKWEKDSDEARNTQEYYFGDWDSKRVEISSGRDLTLVPAQDGEPLNDFGYPYAEVDGDPLDFYDPENFVYTYTFKAD